MYRDQHTVSLDLHSLGQHGDYAQSPQLPRDIITITKPARVEKVFGRHSQAHGGVLGMIPRRARRWTSWSMWAPSTSGYSVILTCDSILSKPTIYCTRSSDWAFLAFFAFLWWLHLNRSSAPECWIHLLNCYHQWSLAQQSPPKTTLEYVWGHRYSENVMWAFGRGRLFIIWLRCQGKISSRCHLITKASPMLSEENSFVPFLF